MTLWASCSSQCSLHNLATVHLSTLSCPVIAFSEASFLPQIWVLVVETVLTPGWVLIQVNFDSIQQIDPKVGLGALLQDYAFTQTWTTYMYLWCMFSGVVPNQFIWYMLLQLTCSHEYMYRWFSWGMASLPEVNSRGPCLPQLVWNTG